MRARKGFHVKPSKIWEAFDSGFALRILAAGHVISTDFPENDVRRTAADRQRAAAFRDQCSVTLPKMGLFGNVRVGSGPRSIQDDDVKNFEGLSVEPLIGFCG